MGTARFIKRALPGGVESNYQQFADMDSDEQSRNSGGEKTSNNLTTSSKVILRNKNILDSSSEGPDLERDIPPVQKSSKDFNYQELDDEYGSKKTFLLKPSNKNYGAGDSSEDVARSVDEEADQITTTPPVRKPETSRVKTHSGGNSSQHQCDRIVGHEYGVKPLLDDDELSDSEFGRSSVNPFQGKEPASSGGSSTLSPQSQLSDEAPSLDVFSKAPFPKSSVKKKKTTSRHASSLQNKQGKSPDVTNDPFANVPFNNRKNVPQAASLLLEGDLGKHYFVNKVALLSDQSVNVFDHVPFRNRGNVQSPNLAGTNSPKQSQYSAISPTSPTSQTISPMSVEVRSLSQSPDVDSVSKTASPNYRDSLQAIKEDSCKPNMDLFGSCNFSEMSLSEAQGKISSQERTGRQTVSPKQPVSAGTSPCPAIASKGERSCNVSNSTSPISPTSTSPYQQISKNYYYKEDTKQKAIDKTLHHGNDEDNQLLQKDSSGSSSPVNEMEGHLVTTPSNKKIAAKTKYYSQRSSMEHLQDENFVSVGEVNTSGSFRKKDKRKLPKQSKSTPGITEFANLGFCDFDPVAQEKEYFSSSHQIEDCVGSNNILNTSMDGALKSSSVIKNVNISEHLGGSNTLPRAGSKKVKNKGNSKALDIEPFVV